MHYALRQLLEINEIIWKNGTMATEATKLRTEIWNSVHKYGTYFHDEFGLIYCYETNGFYSEDSEGNYCNMMDDANVPSLLSIPYFTDEYNRSIFENTVQFVLSKSNRYYFEGKSAKGVGSPHTPNNYVWPIALVSQGMFADRNDRYEILSLIVNSTAGTLFMHESFDVNEPKRYTRKWFAWANAYFSVFANCLNQFIGDEEVESVVNETIPLQLLNVAFVDIKELKDVEIESILNKTSCVRHHQINGD